MQREASAGDAELHIAATRHRQFLAVPRRLRRLVVKTATGESRRIEKTRQGHGCQDTDQHHDHDQFYQGKCTVIGSEENHRKAVFARGG